MPDQNDKTRFMSIKFMVEAIFTVTGTRPCKRVWKSLKIFQKLITLEKGRKKVGGGYANTDILYTCFICKRFVYLLTFDGFAETNAKSTLES